MTSQIKSVEIGETDVLDQELASPNNWVTTLVLQKQTMVIPTTKDEITIMMELCYKLENDFINTLDIIE